MQTFGFEYLQGWAGLKKLLERDNFLAISLPAIYL